MESIQTKEVSTALGSLSKHKNRAGKPQNVAVQPVAIIVEKPTKLEEAATSVQPPVNPPVTPELKPEPQPNDTTNWKERWSQLKTHYDNDKSESRKREQILQDELAKVKAPQIQLPKTKEEIDEYRKKYPEAMDVFTTIALETAGKTSKELQRELAEINQFKAELKGKEAFKELLKLHSDAEEIRSSEKFKEWYNEQPLDIQRILAESTDIRAVAKQLTLYKLEVLGINPKAMKVDETKAALDASLGVEIKGRPEITAQKKVWTKTEIDQVCADYKTYLKYRTELDDARREGRVDYSK